MRIRYWLLGLTFSLVLLTLSGIAATPTTGYQTSPASLRALWTRDLAAGVAPSQLAPLQSILDRLTAPSLSSLSVSSSNSSLLSSEVSSLRDRTNAIYQEDLIIQQEAALTARAELVAALTPLTASQSDLQSQQFATAQTPADFSALATTWHLGALLVPTDRSLFASLTTLNSLNAQAATLSLSNPEGTTLATSLTNYFTLSSPARYAAAPALQISATSTLANLPFRLADATVAKAASDAADAAAYAQSHPIPVYHAPVSTYVAPHPAPLSSVLHLHLTGNYSDCKGNSLLPNGLFHDTCIPDTYYLVSHKYSVGATFFALKIGSQIAFNGRTWTVSKTYTVTPVGETSHFGESALTLQTCYTDSGSIFLIIEAN